MCADFAIHDTGGGNPHAHILLTMRPFEQDGEWGSKQKKEYILDPQRNKIYDPKKRQYKCKSIPVTDWNEQTKAEEWRSAWAVICNQTLEQNGHAERINHCSYARQEIDQIPTIHLGVATSVIEKHGIRTKRGDTNREIEVANKELRQLKARISKLQNWLKEEAENIVPPTLADTIEDILSRREQTGKSDRYQAIGNLKAAANMLSFLQQNQITDMAGLEEKILSMLEKQSVIRNELKPVERRLKALDEHIKHAGIYLKYKGKPRVGSDEILFTAANNYLKGVMNGKTTLPARAWKAERSKLADDKKRLYGEYTSLKNETAEVEKIRKSVYDIIRKERRETPRTKARDIEL